MWVGPQLCWLLSFLYGLSAVVSALAVVASLGSHLGALVAASISALVCAESVSVYRRYAAWDRRPPAAALRLRVVPDWTALALALGCAGLLIAGVRIELELARGALVFVAAESVRYAARSLLLISITAAAVAE